MFEIWDVARDLKIVASAYRSSGFIHERNPRSLRDGYCAGAAFCRGVFGVFFLSRVYNVFRSGYESGFCLTSKRFVYIKVSCAPVALSGSLRSGTVYSLLNGVWRSW